MKVLYNAFSFILALTFIISMDIAESPSPKMVFVGEAEAVIGVPWSPVSYAGVARRTTRRAVMATSAASASTAQQSSAPPPQQQQAAPPPSSSPPPASASYSPVPTGTIVSTLPEGCTTVVVGGASYNDCGGVFYKTAFQGNNLVYVVVERPVQ